MLRETAYNLWSACLCSGPPMLNKLFDELKNPKPGDLVMEVTTHRMKSMNPIEGIGTLVKITREPIFTRERAIENGYGENEEIPEEEVWTIKLVFGDGRELRWKNASFIKVKIDQMQY